MTNLGLTRGDDATLEIPVMVAEDALAVTFTAKRALADDDVDAVIRKDLDGGVAIGEDSVAVTLEPSDTRDLVAPVTLLWDLEVVAANGLTTTVASGYVSIAPDVTRESGFVLSSGS